MVLGFVFGVLVLVLVLTGGRGKMVVVNRGKENGGKSD